MQDTIVIATFVIVSFLAGRYYGRLTMKNEYNDKFVIDTDGNVTYENKDIKLTGTFEQFYSEPSRLEGESATYDIRGIKFDGTTEGEVNNQQNGQDEPQTNQK